jgi:glycogen operon protein
MNDRFRDCVRRFWRGRSGVSELTRVASSQDFRKVRAWSSVNFVTAHDSFTLRDLVSYAISNDEWRKSRRDQRRSFWNNGVRGDSADLAVRRRGRAIKQAACDAFFSRGTPMLAMGSEWARRKAAITMYAQDNALNWLDWAGPIRRL